MRIMETKPVRCGETGCSPEVGIMFSSKEEFTDGREQAHHQEFGQDGDRVAQAGEIRSKTRERRAERQILGTGQEDSQRVIS